MNRPLFGKSILVTRPRRQAHAMAEQLRSLGAQVFLMPALEIAPLEDFGLLDTALRSLAAYDWVVLTSVNGVEAVVSRLDALGIDRRDLAAKKLAVIGPATAEALAKKVREPDLIPSEYVSEAIAEALGDVAGQRFLLARADKARRDLALILTRRGAAVEEVAAYRIEQAPAENELPLTTPTYLVLTSSAGVHATNEILNQSGRGHWMHESRLACIGPITAATVEEIGLKVHLVAEEFTVPGLIEAITGDAEKLAHV